MGADMEFNEDNKVTYAFTIGCFDLLHFGHVKLFSNMRRLGQKLVVGVHDDESIIKLKNRVPMQTTAQRVNNVLKYVDEVFIVAGTDPTPFIELAIKERLAVPPQSLSMIYVRGDDMPHFPARPLVEKYMSITLLPYTQGVSSTMLRSKLLAANKTTSEPVLHPFADVSAC